MSDVKFTNNADKVLKEFEEATERGLESIGKTAEGYAVKEITKADRIDTGRLRNSITHKVKDKAVYIGTNVKYAIYIELGTGIYASNGNGRKTPWAFKDQKGKWHRTVGIPPVHMLQKAAQEHSEEYQALLKASLNNEML